MTAALPSKYQSAQSWADAALAKLATMALDDRHIWCATKPAGQAYFNYRRVSYVAKTFPGYRQRFEELGISVR
ncbi:hypothetical protein U8C35_06335 [Sinorhizobium medicae]|uniref:hypothetical protein n=1 Tax=Sinorhizobium medicae TaxID=110321 RepID=UPI002AF6A121|nr:hypothetical protein [Sinorhizobium medicae]WQO60050.1 hypothetical protein U8C35_06335 [Sinorhizobium medicae]